MRAKESRRFPPNSESQQQYIRAAENGLGGFAY